MGKMRDALNDYSNSFESIIIILEERIEVLENRLEALEEKLHEVRDEKP